MTEELEPILVDRAKVPEGTGGTMPQAKERGVNGARRVVVTTLTRDGNGISLRQPEQSEEMNEETESARLFLRENLSEKDWRQVEDACAQNPQGYLIFRDLVTNKNPTTFDTLLNASPVYGDNKEMLKVFGEFARSGINSKGSDEEARVTRARATNTIIFLARTKPFHLGDSKIFGFLAEIARKTDVTELLPGLYKANGNIWGILLVCFTASQKAGLPEAEASFQQWFNKTRTKKPPSPR